MGKYVYLKVTKDKYEYPLAMADSICELARIVGVDRTTIHRNLKKENGRYKKVPVEE